MKAVTIAVVLVVLLASVPVVQAGPPEPPMQEFLQLYFQAEQEIARARLDKPTRDTLHLLLDNAWTVWMYAEYSVNKAATDARAIKMARSILQTLKEIKGGAPGAEAMTSRITLLLTFQYMVDCQMFSVEGGRWYVCGKGVYIYCRGLRCTRGINE